MPKMSVVQEEVITFLAARMDYPPQTPAEQQAYERALHEAVEDMAEADFRHACKQYRRTGKKWPSPASIVELAPVAAMRQLEEVERRIDWWPIVVPTRSTAGRGATDGRLFHCFRSYAASRLNVEADEEDFRRVNAAVVAIGGWDAIGAMSEQDALYARGRFIKALEGRQEPDNVLRLADEAARRKQLRGGPQRIGGV